MSSASSVNCLLLIDARVPKHHGKFYLWESRAEKLGIGARAAKGIFWLSAPTKPKIWMIKNGRMRHWRVAGKVTLEFGARVKSVCSANLNCCAKFLWPKFGFSGCFKNFISLWIKLARGLDYLSLEEYPWIPFSLTVAIVDRLLFTISYAEIREQRRLRF